MAVPKKGRSPSKRKQRKSSYLFKKVRRILKSFILVRRGRR